MRLNLEGLDASGLDLDFSSDLAHERHIVLGGAKGLRGTLTRKDDSLRLSDVTAESLVVSLLSLKFESFAITLESEGALTDVTGSYERRSERTDITVEARELRAPLIVHFSSLQVRGELRATNVHLHIAGAERRIRADALEIHQLSLSSKVALGAERLVAKNVDVSWGPAGYSVRMGELHVPEGVAELDLAGSFGPDAKKEKSESSGSAESRGSLVEWTILDGLSGPLDVDVHVDMKVPVIGSRRAVHPLRISIQSGTLNYLDLEGNLSPIEDSLLDFAVRDGSLVLERGIPLLPTRGHGKPMVVWPLSADDLALTAKDRVRLAVLPKARLVASQSSPPAESSRSSASSGPSFALRQLSFVDIQALLRLAPIESTTPLRSLSFDEFAIQGTVHHRADGEPPSGQLTGVLRGFAGRVVQLPLGKSKLEVGQLQLAALANIVVQLRDIHPQRLTFDLADLRATALSIGNRNN